MKIKYQFLANYTLMFIISTMVAMFTFMLLDFANHVISKTLVKNNFTAERLMQDDYSNINTAPVVENGGGIQVVNSNYEIVFSAGLNTFTKKSLTVSEFTEFLTLSRSKGIPYSYDTKYNSVSQFWLIVTFPTSIRIDFAIVHNKNAVSRDMNIVAGIILAIVLFYLILLALSTVIYSKITSMSIINPLKKLCISTRKLRDGDYSARVDLNLKNEFGELQDTFNAMANQIGQEISLRKKSEENRKRLILDISHDLKNPLASIMGYAELCRNTPNLPEKEFAVYSNIIYENCLRANNLVTDLFELSKMESSEFELNKSRFDVCEYVRETMGKAVPLFENAGFTYEFNIPDEEIFIMLDQTKMDRVFQNLVNNALQYNPEGTKITVEIYEENKETVILFKDNGNGIPYEKAKEIFRPFVRSDNTRNTHPGGSGLGLAIVEKIISAHGGSINLITDKNCGCEFFIRFQINQAGKKI